MTRLRIVERRQTLYAGPRSYLVQLVREPHNSGIIGELAYPVLDATQANYIGKSATAS